MKKNKRVLKIIIEPMVKLETSFVYQMEDEFLGGLMYENPSIIPDYFGRNPNKYFLMSI